jgi:hypothetical protein
MTTEQFEQIRFRLNMLIGIGLALGMSAGMVVGLLEKIAGLIKP